MGVAALHRTVDKLLARVGEPGEGEGSLTYNTDLLPDDLYFELERLMEKASAPGWPCGANLTPEERERLRELLGLTYVGAKGTSRLEPWLLGDEDLDRLHDLLKRGQNPRTRAFEPDRLSEDDLADYQDVVDKARVSPLTSP